MNLSALVELSQKEVVLQRNECLHFDATVDTNIYFIDQGSLKIFVLDDGSEQIIRFGYAGNMVVFLDSFITGKPSAFRMQALKKTALKVISKDQLDVFLSASTEHENLWVKILEDLVMQQIEREIDLLTAAPLERYLRVLKRSPNLFQEIPNRHIANYLRMTPETLSRIKAMSKNLDSNQAL